MKILFLANTFPSPDKVHVSPFNLRAVNNLIAAGIDVEVIHLRSWTPKRKVIDTYEIDGIKITAVCLPYYANFPPAFRGLNVFLYKLLFSGKVRRLTDLSAIDIIHSVGAAHAGIVGSYISRKSGIPHICQCIGSDVNVVLPDFAGKWGVKGFENNVDTFVGNSISLADQAKKLFPASRTEVIYRGVNLNKFLPDPDKRHKDTIVFSFIGGFSVYAPSYGKNEKGGLTLLKAWKLVAEKLAANGHKAKLIFGGPRLDMKDISAVTGPDPLALNIEVIGQVARDKVNDLFQRSHVVIIPSMFEGLPNAGMEAAACGCALIGSDTGGIPEIILKGNIGILVEAGNEKALAEAILQLIENDRLLNDFMDRSRPFIEEQFDSAHFAGAYINLYQNAIARHEN